MKFISVQPLPLGKQPKPNQTKPNQTKPNQNRMKGKIHNLSVVNGELTLTRAFDWTRWRH